MSSIEMPQISKLRKSAIRDTDRSRDPAERVSKTKQYRDTFASLPGTPKNKATATFLKNVQDEFVGRVEGEEAAKALKNYFSTHMDQVPRNLKTALDLKSPSAFRVTAGGGQGTGPRELSLDVPIAENHDGLGSGLYKLISQTPELASVAKKLKPSQWGGVYLWVRSTLDTNRLGWSTENVPHAFRQVQHPTSDGGEKVTYSEPGNIIQALANLGILGDEDRDTPEWIQAKKDFVAEFKKLDQAGKLSPDTRNAFLEDIKLYKMEGAATP